MDGTTGTPVRWVLRTAGFAVLYAGAVVLGRATRLESTQLALVWPAIGVAVLWVLGSPHRRARAADGLALFALTAVINAATATGPLLSVCFGIGNVVNAFVCVAVLRRVGATHFSAPRDLLGLGLAAVAGAASSAVIGPVASELITGQGELAVTVPAWVLRNTVSVVVVAVVGLTLARFGEDAQRRRRHVVNAAVLLVAAAAVLWPVFVTAQLPLAFLVLPLGAWAALVLPTAESVLYAAGVGTLTVWATLLGTGPFSGLDVQPRAAVAQAFLITMVGFTALLAAYRDDRDRLVHQLWTARQAAHDQGRLLDSVIDSISDGVVLVDSAGAPVIWNAAARRFLPRIEAEPGVFIPFYDVRTTTGAPVAPMERPLGRAMAGQVVPQTDFQVVTPEGSRVLAVSARPVYSASRADALAVFHDVSADRAREAELSAFAGSVAHDLGNPLSAADGWLEVVEECLQAGGTTDLDEAAVAAGRARAATTRMRSLIADLLAYSTARGAALDLGPVDLAVVVDDVLADHLDRSGTPPLVEVGPLPLVQADLVLVRQLLANVVGNAIKYSPDDTQAELDITGGTGLPGGRAWLEVRDHGIGIPDGEHDAVFAEFRRSRTGGRSGTGLGLAICRRIATRHGGSVTARSAPGGGTIVRVELPAAATPTEHDVLASATAGDGRP